MLPHLRELLMRRAVLDVHNLAASEVWESGKGGLSTLFSGPAYCLHDAIALQCTGADASAGKEVQQLWP